MLLNQIEGHEHDSQVVAEEVTACSFCKGNNIVFDAERGEKLCSNCGIVLAEGVETEDQLNFLITKGCDYIQGYYFSKPLEASYFTQLLLSHRSMVKYTSLGKN